MKRGFRILWPSILGPQSFVVSAQSVKHGQRDQEKWEKGAKRRENYKRCTTLVEHVLARVPSPAIDIGILAETAPVSHVRWTSWKRRTDYEGGKIRSSKSRKMRFMAGKAAYLENRGIRFLVQARIFV